MAESERNCLRSILSVAFSVLTEGRVQAKRDSPDDRSKNMIVPSYAHDIPKNVLNSHGCHINRIFPACQHLGNAVSALTDRIANNDVEQPFAVQASRSRSPHKPPPGCRGAGVVGKGRRTAYEALMSVSRDLRTSRILDILSLAFLCNQDTRRRIWSGRVAFLFVLGWARP